MSDIIRETLIEILSTGRYSKIRDELSILKLEKIIKKTYNGQNKSKLIKDVISSITLTNNIPMTTQEYITYVNDTKNLTSEEKYNYFVNKKWINGVELKIQNTNALGETFDDYKAQALVENGAEVFELPRLSSENKPAYLVVSNTGRTEIATSRAAAVESVANINLLDDINRNSLSENDLPSPQEVINDSIETSNRNFLNQVNSNSISENDLPDPQQVLNNSIQNAPNIVNSESVTSSQSSGILNTQNDWRLRIKSKPGKEIELYGPANDVSNPLSILHKTNGILFPYTPNITISKELTYQELQTVHSIQDQYYFVRSPSQKLQIETFFTSQNEWEARYSFAVMHFFKSHNMYFGDKESNDKRGAPPPMLILDGYGDFMFNSLPIIITSVNIPLTNDVDYVPVSFSKDVSFNDFNLGIDIVQDTNSTDLGTLKRNSSYNTAWVPTKFNLSLSIIIQNTPYRIKNDFKLSDLKTGKLLGPNIKGWF